MEWVVWYGIVLIILVGIIIWLVICFIDMKKDRNNWSEKFTEANNKANMYREQVVKLTNEKTANKLTGMEVHEGEVVVLKDYPYFEGEKQILESRLEEIKFAEKYPLCEDIIKSNYRFVDFFINGKCIGTWTKQGAIDYAKKNFKQIDWTNINAITEIVGAYDVVKKPSKK